MTGAALPQLTRFAFAALCLPATQGMRSGGNWFDILPLSESRVAIAVGDLVGHGPPAAATMVTLRSALAGHLLAGCQPADALAHLDQFARHVDRAPASSATCVVLNAKDQSLTWASAGHPPPLVVDTHGARYLDGATETVLAVSRRPSYRQRHTTFGPGASLLLYTDGLIKQRGKPIEQGLARLAAATTTAADTALRPIAPVHLLTRIHASLLTNASPDRDITLLLARLADDVDRSGRRTRVTLIP
ncbi:MAG: PP2C family protein-serine/threonine phosphatase [Pseudonocardiaceae bacterium]